MKSDFVAAVTHELKTPVALIRLVGDTLANGRYTSPETVREYAGLLSVEASRLGSSIDNLLTYARYSELRAADATKLVDVEAADLVEDALQGFRPTLATLEFELIVELPPDLPQVVRRPAGVIQALENIIDNAIKYSAARARLAVIGTGGGQEPDADRQGLRIRDLPRGPGPHLRALLSRPQRRPPAAAASGCRSRSASSRATAAGSTCGATVGAGTEVDVTLPTSGWRRNG